MMRRRGERASLGPCAQRPAQGLGAWPPRSSLRAGTTGFLPDVHLGLRAPERMVEENPVLLQSCPHAGAGLRLSRDGGAGLPEGRGGTCFEKIRSTGNPGTPLCRTPKGAFTPAGLIPLMVSSEAADHKELCIFPALTPSLLIGAATLRPWTGLVPAHFSGEKERTGSGKARGSVPICLPKLCHQGDTSLLLSLTPQEVTFPLHPSSFLLKVWPSSHCYLERW